MNRQDEQQVLKQVYKDASQAAKEIEQGLAKILDEELSLEMNLFLEQWKLFAKKAEKRIDTDVLDNSKLAADQSEIWKAVMRKNLEEQQETKLTDLEDIKIEKQRISKVPDEQLVQRLIDQNQKTSDHLKYVIHEWKEAGLYATELAKEIIDFEEAAAKKLKIYL